ncbi:MAG: hypothetical protein J6J43_01055 [Oscillospiraceae bacterium]|nr:hypothetical protein [Oscillospiraceae bacterium]
MLNEALKKLDPKTATGQKEKVMAPSVAEVLKDFCKQDAEFAQAVAQGGSFKDCMAAVARGVGGSISDIDAYKKAVQFYFPGAEIRVQMEIDLIGAAAGSEIATSAAPPRNDSESRGIVLNLEDFL